MKRYINYLSIIKPFCNGGGCLNIKMIIVGVLGNWV